MKKQLLTLALLTAIAAPSAFAAIGTADQNVAVSVPEVALLAINQTGAASFDCTNVAPTLAGNNFESCEGSNISDIPYAITANLSAGGSTPRMIKAKTLLPLDSTWKLTAQATTAPGTVDATQAVELSEEDAILVTGIGNIASSMGKIAYTLSPKTASQAMAYSAGTTIAVTYTLSEDAV